MPFIETETGIWINETAVATVRPVAPHRWSLYDAEGRKLGYTSSDPERWPTAYLPAAPGLVALRHYSDGPGDPGYTGEQPVLGWALVSAGIVPVVADAYPHQWSDYAVQYPDGRVVSPGQCVHDDREQWLRHIRRERGVAA